MLQRNAIADSTAQVNCALFSYKTVYIRDG